MLQQSSHYVEKIKEIEDSNDVLIELQNQIPNEDAPAYDYFDDGNNGYLQSMTDLDQDYLQAHKQLIQHPHFEFKSLDDLFPEYQQALGISEIFNTNASFRNELRNAIRLDMILDSNADNNDNNRPFSEQEQPSIYDQMTDHQRLEELQRNKPLIGYWKPSITNVQMTTTIPRMKYTTQILHEYLGPTAPTGDEFFERIGSLCQSIQTPYHVTEVVGVSTMQNKRQGEKSDHAWHQDYGHLQRDANTNNYQNNKHVFMAFPCEDNYVGTGVFSHIVKLKYEQWTKPNGQQELKPGQSIFYRGTIPDKYIVRPKYEPGKELILFRDIDVLHSSPDIQHRTSIIRFG